MCTRDGLCYNCAATLFSYVIVGNMIFGAWWFVGGPGLNANKVDVLEQENTANIGILSSNHTNKWVSNILNRDNVSVRMPKGRRGNDIDMYS